MGLALGKSLREIRSLPYPEFQKWQIFYALEPWGFLDREYQFAALRSEIYNTKVTKKIQLRGPKHFMRDMLTEIVKYLKRERTKINDLPSVEIDLSTQEGRDLATERVLKGFEAMFGGRLIRKDK